MVLFLPFRCIKGCEVDKELSLRLEGLAGETFDDGDDELLVGRLKEHELLTDELLLQLLSSIG